jgi:hypothetical protein
MNIPKGWKLVPVEPTPEMLAATSWPKCAETDYRHMLDAAPTPPVVQQDDEVLEVLRELVAALENAFISSWQSTAAWQDQLDAASALLTKRGTA